MMFVRLVPLVLLTSLASGGCRSRAERASAASKAAAGIGIAECDDYLSKYGRCVAEKVPSEQRPVYEENVTRMRAAWKTMAADPGVRPGLGQSCAMALESARSSMQSFNCDW